MLITKKNEGHMQKDSNMKNIRKWEKSLIKSYSLVAKSETDEMVGNNQIVFMKSVKSNWFSEFPG